MKNKKNRKIKYFIIVLFLLIIIFLMMSIMVRKESIKEIFFRYAFDEEAIDKETGMVNNKYFNINSNGEDSENTTKGINEAINYAAKNNIKQIKFEKGHYLIRGTGNRNVKKGIQIKSNISIDLNNSVFEHEENNQIRYSIFTLYNIENVSLKNGIIIGDREKHNYDDIESTHEWGYGIEIQGSTNIEIENLQIQSTTGDGILITSYKDNGRLINSENIKIYNNNIYDCRRQGISIICGKNIEIYDNEIHQINGTAPGATIDLEPDNETQLVENVKIYNNKLYNKDNKTTIQIIKYIKNIQIYDNIINGNISISAEQEKGKVSNNIISNGTIKFSIPSNNITENRLINKLEILDNNFTNCSISIVNVKNLLFDSNKLNGSKIVIQNSNVAISNNEFYELGNNYAYRYELDANNILKYNIYLYNNNVGEEKEKIPESDNIIIHREKKEFEEYIKDTF